MKKLFISLISLLVIYSCSVRGVQEYGSDIKTQSIISWDLTCLNKDTLATDSCPDCPRTKIYTGILMEGSTGFDRFHEWPVTIEFKADAIIFNGISYNYADINGIDNQQDAIDSLDCLIGPPSFTIEPLNYFTLTDNGDTLFYEEHTIIIKGETLIDTSIAMKCPKIEPPCNSGCLGDCDDPSSIYLLSFSHHAMALNQLSGLVLVPGVTGTLTFRDFMMPQPTPATTITGGPLAIGGMNKAEIVNSANWLIVNTFCPGQGYTLTQRDQDNLRITDVWINGGSVGTALSESVGDGAGIITSTDLNNALLATGLLPVCLSSSTTSTIEGSFTNNTADCVDYIGSNISYQVPCDCFTSGGAEFETVIIRTQTDSNDAAFHIFLVQS